MKIIKVGLKIWLVLALIAAVAIGVGIVHHGGVNIFYDDEPVQGVSALAIGMGVALLAIIGVTILIAVVGVMVPLIVALALVVVVCALCVAALAVGGVLAAACAPILIPLMLCVLLVRFIFSRSRTRDVRTTAHP